MKVIDKENLFTKDVWEKIKEIIQGYEYLTGDLLVESYNKNTGRIGLYHPVLNKIMINARIKDEKRIVGCFAHEFAHFLQHKKIRKDFKGISSERDAQFFEVSTVNRLYGTSWKLSPNFYHVSVRGNYVRKRELYDSIVEN